MTENKKRRPTALVMVAVLSLLVIGTCGGVALMWPKEDPEVKFKTDKDRWWQLEDEINTEMREKTPGRKDRILKRVEEQNLIVEKWPGRMAPIIKKESLPPAMLED